MTAADQGERSPRGRDRPRRRRPSRDAAAAVGPRPRPLLRDRGRRRLDACRRRPRDAGHPAPLGGRAPRSSATRRCGARGHALPPRPPRRQRAARAAGRCRRGRAGPGRPAADVRRLGRPGVVPGAFEAYLLHHGMPAEEAARSAGDEGDIPVHPAEPTRLVDEGDTVEIAGEPFRGAADAGPRRRPHRPVRRAQRPLLRRRRAAPRRSRRTWGAGRTRRPTRSAATCETLRRIERLAPRVVYPGHRAVIEDPAARAREIIDHHGERLDVHLEALRLGARSAFDVGKHVWGGRLGFHEQRLRAGGGHLAPRAAGGRGPRRRGRARPLGTRVTDGGHTVAVRDASSEGGHHPWGLDFVRLAPRARREGASAAAGSPPPAAVRWPARGGPGTPRRVACRMRSV